MSCANSNNPCNAHEMLCFRLEGGILSSVTIEMVKSAFVKVLLNTGRILEIFFPSKLRPFVAVVPDTYRIGQKNSSAWPSSIYGNKTRKIYSNTQ